MISTTDSVLDSSLTGNTGITGGVVLLSGTVCCCGSLIRGPPGCAGLTVTCCGKRTLTPEGLPGMFGCSVGWAGRGMGSLILAPPSDNVTGLGVL